MRTVFLVVCTVMLSASMPIDSPEVELVKLIEVDLEQTIGQLRSVPVSLDGGRTGLLLVHGMDEEVDPWEEMFFYPKGELTMTLVDEGGSVLWSMSLGPGVIPGIWFCPVFPFDLDSDGIDEIYFVDNVDQDHPLSLNGRRLARLDISTGEKDGEWEWPRVPAQSPSHQYRNFILGGYAHGTPVLVTAQGTYGPMALQAWTNGMEPLWEHQIGSEPIGPRGSHMTPIVDIDSDGIDEILWGERVIDLSTGEQEACGDCDTWGHHSDIIQPTYDWGTGQWMIYTCREGWNDVAPRVVMFDDAGQRLWSDIEHGHMDMGWTAHVKEDGGYIAMAIRIGGKAAGPDGFVRRNTESFAWDAITGKSYELGFAPYQTLPVDITGDGLHEFVYMERGGAFEPGTVIDRDGEILGHTYGRVSHVSRFLEHPGEHIVTYVKEGKVSVWANGNARDTEAATRRYHHPFYRKNQRLAATGYNRSNLGGI